MEEDSTRHFEAPLEAHTGRPLFCWEIGTVRLRGAPWQGRAEMSAGFWKRNEKIIMTLLLLVLAPAFAFTGIMTWWLTQGRQEGQAVYRIHGDKYTLRDFNHARDELARRNQVSLMRQYGPFAFPPYNRTGATEDATLSYLMRRGEIDQLGIQVAEQAKQKALREAALDVLTWYRVMRDRDWIVGVPTEALEAFNALRPAAKVNLDEYVRAVKELPTKLSGRSAVPMNVEDFEHAVLESARDQSYLSLVTDLAIVTEREMYEEFKQDRQKRDFEYISVSSLQFEEQATEEIDEEYLRGVYEQAPQMYRKDASFQLLVAKADRDKFADPDYEPELAEIEAQYEKDKGTRYRIRHPDGWEPPENYDPEIDDYRNLADVFASVVTTLRDNRASEAESEVLSAAIEQANELIAAGTEWNLEDLFDDATKEKIIFDDLGWVTRANLGKLSFDYQNYAILNGLFSNLDPNRIGEISRAAVANRNGDYIFKIVGFEPQSTKSFEDAIADVQTNAEKQKRKEICEDYLTEWVQKIRDDEEVTLESFAADENYTVQSSEEPLGRNEGSKLLSEGQRVLAGYQLVQALFADTNQVGEVTNPVMSPADDSLYIAKLKDIAPPDMAQWDLARPGLESRVRSQRQAALGNEFISKLEEKADVRELFERIQEPVPEAPQG